MSQISEFRELLQEAVDHYPQIKYGNKFSHVTDSRFITDWLWNWVPRVQRALDALKMAKSMCNHDLAEKETMCTDGFCPVCMYERLIELEKKLKIYGTPITIEMQIDEMERKIADLEDDRSKWQHTIPED